MNTRYVLTLCTPCGLLSEPRLLTAGNDVRRGGLHGRRGSTDGSFLAHRSPPHRYCVHSWLTQHEPLSSVDTTVVGYRRT